MKKIIGIDFACLVYLSALSLTLADSSPATTNTSRSARCPLLLNYVTRIPWNSSLCNNFHPNSTSKAEMAKETCCATLFSVFGIGLAGYLKVTSLFQLPNLPTSISCLQDFQTKLNSLSLPSNLVSLCFDPTQFVITPDNNCANIKTTKDWVAKLGESTVLDQGCSSNLNDLTACDNCSRAANEVHTKLVSIDGNTTHSALCFYLTVLYGAGIANYEEGPESNGAVQCAFGLSWKESNFSDSLPDSQVSGSNSRFPVKLALGVGAASLLIIGCIMITLSFRRKIQSIRTIGYLWKFTKTDPDVEAFIRNNRALAPKRYSYSDVRKMTKSFEEKLGKGGYGTVYKGKQLDGRLVAVKVLNTTKGNGQEFINEVAIISRTSHVNVVSLIGFCFEGQKRVLIYEYMPKGSLERFIYKENTLQEHQRLTSEKLYKIAIGIARGLEYLHRGCSTRIVHFDIKPHNILLDENFNPKISDFGLAKPCTGEDSIVSMLEARGTIGYIAPEVFYRNIGSVSHKSDVYSYGMMILEMVGGRRNADVLSSRTSEIYFPHWIYQYVEQGNIEPELLGLMSREETEIARQMIIVGFWCIQTNPVDRPSMSKVVEMLERSIEVSQIPPKPYMSSPPRSPTVDFTSSLP